MITLKGNFDCTVSLPCCDGAIEPTRKTMDNKSAPACVQKDSSKTRATRVSRLTRRHVEVLQREIELTFSKVVFTDA